MCASFCLFQHYGLCRGPALWQNTRINLEGNNHLQYHANARVLLFFDDSLFDVHACTW